MRRRPVIVPTIVALNALVFVAWQLAQRPVRSGTLPEASSWLSRFMVENFMISWLHLQEGHWWTLLTSEFSHVDTWHIMINMFVLWGFGGILERLWGRRLFTGFYLVAAVVASGVHALVSAFLIGDSAIPAVGASGAISGLLIAYALSFPKQKILLFGIIPVPALVAAGLFVGLDLWGLAAQARGGGLPIGHGAHLGGAVCGLVLWLAVLKPRFGRIELSAPRRPVVSLDPEEAAAVERIRRTMARDGLEGLTPKERALLERLRERALREG